MPWLGHDALDLRVPVDVVSSAAAQQEPSVPFESAPDSSSGGVHACRYLHDRPAEGQPAHTPPRHLPLPWLASPSAAPAFASA